MKNLRKNENNSNSVNIFTVANDLLFFVHITGVLNESLPQLFNTSNFFWPSCFLRYTYSKKTKIKIFHRAIFKCALNYEISNDWKLTRNCNFVKKSFIKDLAAYRCEILWVWSYVTLDFDIPNFRQKNFLLLLLFFLNSNLTPKNLKRFLMIGFGNIYHLSKFHENRFKERWEINFFLKIQIWL